MLLGIDIGTTNVKIVWFEPVGSTVVKSVSFNHDAELKNVNEKFAEQNPRQIIDKIFEKLQGVENVTGIAVCGQMHGILCWDTHFEPVTNLVTWEDARLSKADCDQLVGGGHRVHPGYGIATLKWWRKYNPEILRSAAACGTIMDYFVAILTKIVNVPMSTHNAHSFGCWVPSSGWQVSDDLLPSISEPPAFLTVISKHFPTSPKILPALGDHQCSVFAAGVPTPENAIFFSFGTSCQMTLILKMSDRLRETGPVEIRPLCPEFGNAITVASTNGGNVIEHFVTVLNRTHEEILSEINLNSEILPIWTSVRLFPERTQKTAKSVSFENLRKDHTPAQLIDGLAKGLVENLFCLLYEGNEGFKMENVNHCFIAGGGSKYVIKHIKSKFKNVEYCHHNAAQGAVMFYQYLMSK